MRLATSQSNAVRRVWLFMRLRPEISSFINPNVSQVIQVSEIVFVQKTEEEHLQASRRKSSTKQPDQLISNTFTVSYVQRAGKHQWRCSDVVFQCPDQSTCEHWITAISNRLAQLANRPKHLLVYINPFGGKKQGKWIYDQKVAPLFHKAHISTDVIVTERANHAREHLEKQADLDQYDGAPLTPSRVRLTEADVDPLNRAADFT
uniref:DAGKc domain-containing protein n=1 Tax=Knipowitschia caucasica TaxID=637954 RepID=A0AAV2ITN6_KNICA